jgi:Tfp pilus assembly PilM family ATPase
MAMSGCRTPVIGIDIGSYAIKLAVLRRRQHRWLLLCGKSELVADNAGETLGSMLASLPGWLRLTRPRIVLAIHCAGVMFRKTKLPATLDHHQVDLALRLELEKHLPQEDQQGLFMDYCPVALEDADSGAGHQHTRMWLTAVCTDAVMQDCLQPLRAVRRMPAQVAIDVMVLAAASSLQSGEHQMAHLPDADNLLHLYIDAGFSSVRLCAMTAGIPGYVRSYPLSGGQLQADCAGFLLIMRRALQQYQMSEMLTQPARVLLYGGRAATPGLSELIRQFFGSNPQIIDPFTDWPVDSACVHSNSLPPTILAPAIALAMQEPMICP